MRSFLEISFDSPNPAATTFTTGTWLQQIANGPPGTSSDNGGTWNANQTSAVPIPGVFVLFGSGLISLIMFGRKSVRSK